MITPIRLKPYRTPFSKRATVDKAIDDMLAANIIQPSRSPWSFPIVVVDKKDGSKRFCTDFRKLNLICKRSSWPLPVIDDMLAVLGKSKYFTTLDLKSGYWQIPLDERDKEKLFLLATEVCMSIMLCLLVWLMHLVYSRNSCHCPAGFR